MASAVRAAIFPGAGKQATTKEEGSGRRPLDPCRGHLELSVTINGGAKYAALNFNSKEEGRC